MPTDFSGGKRPVNTQRLLMGLIVIALGLYVAWNSFQQPAARPEPASDEPLVNESVQDAPQGSQPAAAASAAKKVQTRIPNVLVRDQEGKVVFRGTVDVGPTLQRIERREKLSFPNDGTVFENRERRLPKKSTGHYREYVHPTPGEAGPGPQRIVRGKAGETFYTHDHYRTFQRLDSP